MLPTAALELILITSCINALEGHDVIMVDIPGAFLTADIDKDVNMVLCGRLAELMVDVEPSLYCKHVTVENRKKGLICTASEGATWDTSVCPAILQEAAGISAVAGV